MANLPPVLKQYWTDANGDPLAGGKIYTYQAGTTTPQATYTDAGGLTPNANPVVLDASGYAAMWLDPTLSYKFVIKDANDAEQQTIDEVIGLLTANAVNTAALQDRSVTQIKHGLDSVGANELQDSASLDADRAVTSDHIRNLAIIGPKLGDTAVAVPVNYALAASVAGNALTIALKAASGSDATTLNPIRIPFRNATSATGTPVVRSVTGALTTVISSTSTAGHTSAKAEYLYVYAIDNSGTVELAWSKTRFDDGSVKTTVAEGGAGAADSGHILYSTTARSNVPIKLLGRLKSTQATAGLWATAISEISLVPLAPLEPIVAKYRATGSTANGSFADNTLEVIDFDSRVIDTHAAVTTGVSWLFTAPRHDLFEIKASLAWTSVTNLDESRLAIQKNGSGQEDYLARGRGSAVAEAFYEGTTIVELFEGETITIQGYANTTDSSARSLDTSLTGLVQVTIHSIGVS